jgi:hypothetical protein
VTIESPFVVFGSAKSGTTWVQRILDAHPEVRCHFQRPIFPVTDESLWTPRKRAMEGSDSPFEGLFEDPGAEEEYRSLHRFLNGIELLRKRPVDGPAGELGRRMQRALVREILFDGEGPRVFGTKAYTDLPTLFDVFPDAKVIHVLRDGRDVAVSKRHHLYRTRMFLVGDERSALLRLLNRWDRTRHLAMRLRRRFGWFGEKAFWSPDSGMPFFSPAILRIIAGDWARVVTYLLDHQRRRPDRFLTVRYEDLKGSPDAAIAGLLEFLDVDSDEGIVAGLREKTSFKAMSGDGKGFFRSGKAGDWKDHFTPGDLEIFAEVAGEASRAAGYQ